METINTQKLYVVKPSIVLSNDNILIKEDKAKGIATYRHTVEFERNNEDIDFVVSTVNDVVYKSIFSDRCYFKGMINHCVKGDYYVGVVQDDFMLLAKYLYLKSVSNPKWTNELEEYIISLKPSYSYKELELLRDALMFDLDEKVEKIKVKGKFKI